MLFFLYLFSCVCVCVLNAKKVTAHLIISYFAAAIAGKN